MSLAQSPAELRDLKHETNTADKAVGVTAVLQSIKHVFTSMPPLRGSVALFKLNQKGGIDCPSCAWPDPDVKDRSAVAEYCESGAKAIAEEATSRKVGSVHFQRYSVEEMGQQTDFWMSQQGRLTHPMFLKEGGTHYEKISWDDAFVLIAEELKALSSPNEAVFYTSGRSSNEAAYLYQLFVRQFGTNNLPDCSNMCHESSGVALGETLGLGKGSTTLHDLENAELIIIMGQNPGTNAPRMLTALEKSKAKGGKIVAINPLVETGLTGYKNPQTVKGMLKGVDLADMYLQIRINSDMALMKALLKIMWEEELKRPGSVFDFDFIKFKTQGYEDMLADLDNYSIEELAADCGIETSQIRELAKMIEERKKIIICWAMGLTQHQNSVPTIQEVVNVLLLRGSIGKPGAGTFPVRGHSNVQGDRSMGIFHKMKDDLAEKIKEYFGFDPPREEGLDVVESIKAMHAGRAKVFVALGGNFLSATPDTEYTAEALQKCNLTVQISTKLNRSHFIHGKKALILPCLGRTDKDVQAKKRQFLTTESSTGVVQKTQGLLSPPSKDLMSEPAIIANLGHKLFGSNSKVNWLEMTTDYDVIRDFISKTVKGCEEMNVRVREENGFELPNKPRYGTFPTDTGKAKFTVNKWNPIRVKDDELLMMTLRSHDQFNTTIYGFDDRYRGIFNERRVVFMNEKDIQKFNFSDYEVVNISSYYDGKKRSIQNFKVVPYSIPEGCIATYYPESNPLIPIQCVAEGSNTPTSKSVIVKVEKQ
jgi:molybdopterin-dependent oxidoreductase alpha subunit